jgi:hypothetical protein
MTWTRALLVPLVVASLAAPAPAGIFSRKPKANPAERVPELLLQLRTSQDEAARAAAAEELRQYDPKDHPEITTALMDALAKDPSTGVRSEAAASIGRLRPISQQAGYALEQAVANDASMRVRMAARTALWQYNLVGYRSGKPAADAPDKANEPANPGPAAAVAPRTNPRAAAGSVRESPEPPLADPLPALPPPGVATAPVPPPAPLVPVNRAKPAGPATNPAPNRKPTGPPQSQGPELPPF